mmetsp:Transcript_61674/g.183706  ORF Transcript_61674/g.183706 Transcript_61674/m.183706 type:complete len:97 (-) Transcript_61674:39-329(-)
MSGLRSVSIGLRLFGAAMAWVALHLLRRVQICFVRNSTSRTWSGGWVGHGPTCIGECRESRSVHVPDGVSGVCLRGSDTSAGSESCVCSVQLCAGW